MAANDEKVVTSAEFCRLLEARAGENEILLAISGSEESDAPLRSQGPSHRRRRRVR